ncbi:hypothetical protein HMPREF9413_5419 [Paenibacillus sp. HGF7]|nr:hypothetical protein HMPREF9413_5419 [Paenibacillus sp. HGF7]
MIEAGAGIFYFSNLFHEITSDRKCIGILCFEVIFCHLL